MEQQTNNNTRYAEEDTIDLRELFLTLKKRKKLIGSVTGLLTILAIVYVLFVAKPIYEVEGLLEIAKIDKKPVENVRNLQEKLEIIFEVDAKGKTIELPIVSSIKLPKEVENMINIQVQGYDNSSSEKKLQEVINYITISQNKELKNFTDLQKKKLDSSKRNIEQHKKYSMEIKKDIDNYEDKLLNISKQDAALAGIYAIEIGKKQSELTNITNQVFYLQNQVDDLESSISPLKIEKTAVVGNIQVLERPIKPKKKLIVIVAFITGLMLSIFLAFFLEFISGMKKEEDKQ